MEEQTQSQNTKVESTEPKTDNTDFTLKRADPLLEINDYLGAVFNLSQFRVFYHTDAESEEYWNERNQLEEIKTYSEIVNGLESDLRNFGMDITYASRIILNDVALNMMLIQRIKAQMLYKNPIRDKEVLKPSETISRQQQYETKKKNIYTIYEKEYLREAEIHPAIKLLHQFEKQIHQGLKDLGLLPSQTIERQKLTIVKKLRQQCENVSAELSVKKEVMGNKKEKLICNQSN